MRRLRVLVAVLVAVVVVAVLVSRLAGRTSDSSAAATASPNPVASEIESAVPEGAIPTRVTASSEPDLDAALEAAVAAVGSTGAVVSAGFISRRDVIAGFTTTRFAPVLIEATSEQINSMLVALGERDTDPAQLLVIEQPLSAEATSSDEGVRVVVWSVMLIVLPGAGPARQAWRTVTVDMVDVDGVWLVDGWSSASGPTPALPPEVALEPAEVFVPLVDAQVGG